MLDLPFLTKPREAQTREIGNQSIGVLSVPVYGCLHVGEVIDASGMLQQDDAMVTGAKLAQRMAVEQSITISEAFQIVEDSATGRELSKAKNKIKIEYLPEIAEVTRLYINAGRERQIAAVTALIRYRLDRPKWTMAETSKLPSPLMEALYILFEEERDSGEADNGGPVSDEDLKK